MADVTSSRSSPAPETCPECDATASVTSDLHKYQVACTCKPGSAQYACADDPGPPPPAKTDTPPALPPRPPTAVLATTRRNNSTVGCNGQEQQCRRRKYAWWCVGCGALAAALGGLLAAQHILVRAYTASPHHLETVPAAVPAAMLVLTGVCIMSLARRRNRYSYMIKVVGACCLMCALTCVLVTITTTVIHMNKLQTLKFCEYTKLTRSCTCFSMPPDSQHGADDEGVRCVFEGVSECGVVHGALYWCLRGVFALSVSAVLVCIFSCMLAYQLLSHERKKMYWEQLELRCRSLYRPPAGQTAPPAGRPVQSCSCCSECGAGGGGGGGAWEGGGRVWPHGNLYSPTPGTQPRKTGAWSWFPWPRNTQHNSRCRMNGVPQSGDSAYGFCENETNPAPNPQPSYEDRAYPPNFTQYRGQTQQFQQTNFGQTGFATVHGSSFAASQANFAQIQPSFQGQYQDGFGETSGSFDAQTGVWGPPPPYSPQGRSGSRHHLHHQDPATATLLHHHHIDVHRNSTLHDHPTIHDHPPIHDHTQPHTCPRNSYLIHQNDRVHPETRLNQDIARLNPELARHNPELSRINQELVRHNQEIRHNPDLVRLNPELVRMNPDLARLNPELARLNPELVRHNPELGHMYPGEDMELAEGRFNTLRGHLVPYRCQRMGMSVGNLHRDCRMDSDVTIECVHQKSASKVSDQSSDSCQKQGKENLGFQNDKHSPIRSSIQDCRGVNQNAESEVYFADVSSCCNVSVKAECCINPNVSLVGTIENHPESTSESDTGSFTLTRQQRPQPQVGSKRRNRQTDKPDKRLNNSARLTEQQIEQLNLRMNERIDSRDRLERVSDSRNELNDFKLSDRMNETRLSERLSERDRVNDSRLERMNDSRISERFNDSRLDRLNDSRIDRINESRSDRMNDSRLGERLNDSRDRGNDSRISERLNDSRISERMNDSRISDRINDSRISERVNDSRIIERLNESRLSERLNDSRSDRMNDSRERMNDSRSERMNDSRIRMNEERHDRTNESRLDRMSDLNSSMRIEGSPKVRTHVSPIRRNSPKDHPRPSLDHVRQNLDTRQNSDHTRQSSDHTRQGCDHSRQSCDHSRQACDHIRPTLDLTRQSLDVKPEFFVPPPPVISPLSPNTEESLLSDDDSHQNQVYSNDPEPSKCLGPDSQYEPVRDEKNEILKTNHHHCYSDTNTMDSGWQSGSEKQVTD